MTFNSLNDCGCCSGGCPDNDYLLWPDLYSDGSRICFVTEVTITSVRTLVESGTKADPESEPVFDTVDSDETEENSETENSTDAMIAAGIWTWEYPEDVNVGDVVVTATNGDGSQEVQRTTVTTSVVVTETRRFAFLMDVSDYFHFGVLNSAGEPVLQSSHIRLSNVHEHIRSGATSDEQLLTANLYGTTCNATLPADLTEFDTAKSEMVSLNVRRFALEPEEVDIRTEVSTLLPTEVSDNVLFLLDPTGDNNSGFVASKLRLSLCDHAAGSDVGEIVTTTTIRRFFTAKVVETTEVITNEWIVPVTSPPYIDSTTIVTTEEDLEDDPGVPDAITNSTTQVRASRSRTLLTSNSSAVESPTSEEDPDRTEYTETVTRVRTWREEKYSSEILFDTSSIGGVSKENDTTSLSLDIGRYLTSWPGFEVHGVSTSPLSNTQEDHETEIADASNFIELTDANTQFLDLTEWFDDTVLSSIKFMVTPDPNRDASMVNSNPRFQIINHLTETNGWSNVDQEYDWHSNFERPSLHTMVSKASFSTPYCIIDWSVQPGFNVEDEEDRTTILTFAADSKVNAGSAANPYRIENISTWEASTRQQSEVKAWTDGMLLATGEPRDYGRLELGDFIWMQEFREKISGTHLVADLTPELGDVPNVYYCQGAVSIFDDSADEEPSESFSAGTYFAVTDTGVVSSETLSSLDYYDSIGGDIEWYGDTEDLPVNLGYYGFIADDSADYVLWESIAIRRGSGPLDKSSHAGNYCITGVRPDLPDSITPIDWSTTDVRGLHDAIRDYIFAEYGYAPSLETRTPTFCIASYGGVTHEVGVNGTRSVSFDLASRTITVTYSYTIRVLFSHSFGANGPDPSDNDTSVLSGSDDYVWNPIEGITIPGASVDLVTEWGTATAVIGPAEVS